ncbi:MAG TPA: PIN domain-containing protein [Thermoplasmata archaeon]|nr:PIN domain-containing protein [Thermoplasmata archaeon]
MDASAWLALADSRDRDHPRAAEFYHRVVRGEFGRQVTTNYVLAETLTIVRRRLGLTQAMELAKAVQRGKEVGLFWVEPVHHHQAIELMSAHEDKEWSVADCSSFVIMRALGIQDAFTFDRDFAQAGFTARP